MRPSGAFVSFFEPVSKTNGATASGYIDTVVNGGRARHASICLVGNSSDAVTDKPSVMKFQQSDDTVTTNFADITGFVGGTSFTVGSQLTSASNVHQFEMDLIGRKRYIKGLVSPTTTQVWAGVAYLSGLPRTPIDSTGAGTLNYVAG